MYPLEGAKAACPSYLLMRGGKVSPIAFLTIGAENGS